MASSMLTAEMSVSESDVDKVLKAALHTCANDPDFAVICDFLQKFSKDLGLDLPNYKLLLQWLAKTDEVTPQLRDMQIKLLRKTRKTVHEKSWESALSKFCFTYSAQDGWEIERFGYKNSNVKVKLRILRELLECQFERNTKFRAKILTLSADSLRSQPIGRDRQGHAYWVTQDNDCNIRIYQEHLDEEIWRVVATNRDEFVNLIKRLKRSEVVQPCEDISIIDEDTNSSSHIDSDAIQKILPPVEKDDSQEGEQKVPKLSIKLVHGKSPNETTNEKYVGKGEEELAAEEDAKLLKKSNSCSDTIDSGEDKFEEIEEEYDDDSGSEPDSEEEVNERKQISKKIGNVTEQKSLNSKTENKKVKPLLISQNKVLKNKSSMTGKKRTLEQINLDMPFSPKENTHMKMSEKSRPTLLDSKRTKTFKTYEDKKDVAENEDFGESSEDFEIEEGEEEDIDSVAAEEDENEEKMFDDYDDDDEEEIGEEICDPVVRVTGEGAGKECNIGNYLCFIDYDLNNESLPILGEEIVEEVYYIRENGNGKECLVGNKNNDNVINLEVKTSSKTNVEEKSESSSKISSPQKEKTMSLENIDTKLSSLVKNYIPTEDNLNDTTKLNEDLEAKEKINNKNFDESHKKGNETEESITLKEDVGQINGQTKSNEVTSKTERFNEKQLDSTKAAGNMAPSWDKSKLSDEKFSKAIYKGDIQITDENRKNSNSLGVDVITKQTEHANKMSALESVKKELRESKQKLLEKKLPETSESCNAKISSLTVYNRKRRLTDQLQTAFTRPQNSESEIDLNLENADELVNDKDLDAGYSGEDVGGKRLKIRCRQANTELRKKIESQKVSANYGNTSSSSGGEDIIKRKKISPKHYPHSESEIKSEMKPKNFESKIGNDPKNDGNIKQIEENSKYGTLSQKPVSLKKGAQYIPSKVKPTLAEIIEKKLNKTPEKSEQNIEKKISSFNKSPITKPLKKNVLTYIKQEESDEDAIPQKCTNSQGINSAGLFDIATSRELNIEKQKTTRERQRKRPSSDETIQNDSPAEPEAKKEITVIRENIIIKGDKVNETMRDGVIIKAESKGCEIQNEYSLPVSGRRSGRRGKVITTYVDNLQKTKRYRGSTKSASKKQLIPCEKDENFEKFNTVEITSSDNLTSKIADKTIEEKSLLKEIFKNEDKTKKNEVSLEVTISKSCSTAKTPVKGVRKQREVDATNIIDIDSETPVRQSRRIAQQKIREEAERRKLEEIALRTMKEELKKKKKAEKQCDPTVVPLTEPSSESEESDIAIKKKVQKKKCPGKNGNWSSGSEEQEEPEEEDEEAPHYETDPGSPLFKSDHEFSPESDIEDESQVVPMKRARTVRKEDADTDAVALNEEEEACQKCNKSDHPEWILLCDNCDKGYHCSCLSPVLFYIPEGDWYCPPCQQEQLIKALEDQLKVFDDLVENKKKAEEQAKLKAEEEKARQEREEETNKSKKDKKAITRRHNGSSSAEDHSREEGDNEEVTSNSDECKDIGCNKQYSMNRNRSRNSKNRDKRNYRDRRHNATRSRRNKLRKHDNNSISDSYSTSAECDSDTNSTSSSAYSESDNEPIYKLRKRRQINVSYRLNEYDDLINSALKKEMDEAAGAGNLGRGKDISTIIEADKEEKARQKQIEDCEVIGKPKEVKNDESVTEQNNVTNEASNDEKIEVIKKEENDSDTEPIIRKLNIKPSQKKKARKLTTLDISSEGDDGSDEDFKGSSFDEEEEDTSNSASNSDSSLEIYKRHGKVKKKRRKAARRAFRERRNDRRFLVDDSDDEEVQRPKSKKKRKDDSDYTESEAEDDISELSENIDSADLCDDTTTDESDCAWRPNKRKKAKKSINISFLQKSPKAKSVKIKKSKKLEYSHDDVSESDDEDDEENEEVGSEKGMGKQPRSQPLKTVPSSTKIKPKGKCKEKPPLKAKRKNSSEEESSQSDSEDSTRRTRGRRYAYIEDFDDDSSDGGIKPGVQRPDTPPEEREKFIKRQEEIKRMLAEKNSEGAKLVATPRLTPIKTDCERDKRSPVKTAGDSLSTVPLSVIRQAKVLDIDYLQRRGENLDDLSGEVGEVDDDFDDADLPDDLPEDMDEDAIARMVEEEEEFSVATAKDLPAPDEILRTPAIVKPTKIKEVEKSISQGSNSSTQSANTSHLTQVSLPTLTSGLQEPVRKRLPMPTMHPPLLRHQFLMQDTIQSTQHLIQRHGNAPTSNLLQNALSAPLNQPLDRNYPPTHPHHSLINRMTHGIHLQPTVPHTLSTTRISQPPVSSTVTKSPSQINQLTQEKPPNPQSVTQSKPRGRRKKITPLRDTLQKQQTAAAVTAATATNSALASSLVKNNDPLVGSILPSAIKSDSTPKLPMQASVITSIPPASHSATSRPGMPMHAISSSYIRTDGPRFYDTLENRISQTSTQRHRGSPQMLPSLLPPHPANRSSYGLPPPLKGSTSGPPLSSLPTTSGSIRNPIRHVPPPFLGIPPNARHASHLNMYRPPMFGNPNFGPRVNLRPPNIHSPDYSPGSRSYPPYSFYPPPPPLTTPGQRSAHSSVSRSPLQMPPVQTAVTHPPASVIVSTVSSKLTNALPPQSAPQSTADITNPVPSSKSALITQESQIKSASSKSSSPTLVIAQTGKVLNTQLVVTEPRKKLTTLQAYVANSAKKSPMLSTSDSSDSRSPLDAPTDVNDEASAPGITENILTDEQQTRQEAQASEFSGLVSYFSSQHDDYNT